ncbi:MAG: metalloregulator ArsR/SmtB family transcription factor [Bacteroidota bacterium]|nr:metalloregulator ArsR/SmtB family transcription factor [Bacteroidota bacterium]
MHPEIRHRYEERARFLKALSHPTRLFIVDELTRGKRCVHELTAAIGDDISTVSKHLSILRSIGIVRDERCGNMVYYALRTTCIVPFFSCIESMRNDIACRSCLPETVEERG